MDSGSVPAALVDPTRSVGRRRERRHLESLAEGCVNDVWGKGSTINESAGQTGRVSLTIDAAMRPTPAETAPRSVENCHPRRKRPVTA